MQILAPLPIGFAVFLVHLATIPITGTGINPARSLGAAIIYNKDHAWDDQVSKKCFMIAYIHFWMRGHVIYNWSVWCVCCVLQWIFWVGPFIGAALAALYHQIVIRAMPFKTRAWELVYFVFNLVFCSVWIMFDPSFSLLMLRVELMWCLCA